MPGMTAYFGLLDVGALKDRETVVISGAAGAVGTIAGQIAKARGCRVVGIAGGPEKCALLTGELGFDAAIDHRTEDVKKALREHAPEGIDVYFDNVGGDILDTALTRLAMHARVVVCGAISQYNNAAPVQGPSEHVVRGTVDGFPATLQMLFRGANVGKLVLELAWPPRCQESSGTPSRSTARWRSSPVPPADWAGPRRWHWRGRARGGRSGRRALPRL
ncbi:NADP-dependent oxidoreductase [Streptomyces sp. NPDC001851]|uniref:NADP-dependent oxidoreductase n=1 Tax=Streptomyces sp. NPDC001851 TaxID=3154529 RepID=UPI003328924D